MAEPAESRLQRLWYGGGWAHLPLVPLSLLYAAAGVLRRRLYGTGLWRSYRSAAPVVVVGNLTVGGTGKTPVTIWLADRLRSRGFRPGIVSRGYGGVVGDTPVQANVGSNPDIVGDEPILLAKRSRCPVVVHPNRVAAAEELVRLGADVVLADDGLQHYRLHRDFEIAVVDGARGFGNGWQLPAGPLREPRARLDRVDRVLVHAESRSGEAPDSLRLPAGRTTGFHLVTHELVSVDDKSSRSFDELRGQTVHAVAAVGNPERFFRALEARGLEVLRHPFPDHAVLNERDLAWPDEHDIVMTEKDAVKCREFATGRHWYVPVDVDMHDEGWLDELETAIREHTGA